MGFHSVWMDALQATLERGATVSPRGMLVAERLAVPVTFPALEALLVHPERVLNYRFAEAEWVWMATGSPALAPLTRYNKQMARFSDDGHTLAGAYGVRLAPQWPRVIQALVRDPDTRQAVNLIWRPNDAEPVNTTAIGSVPRTSKDVPCTIAAQFLAREGELHGIWTMRSSDLWLGLPYDAYTFARLTCCMAGATGYEPGTVTIFAGSSHLYEEHWPAAERVLEFRDQGRSVRSQPLPGFPPAAITQLLLTGQPLLEERGKLAPVPAPWQKTFEVLQSATSATALDILES